MKCLFTSAKPVSVECWQKFLVLPPNRAYVENAFHIPLFQVRLSYCQAAKLDENLSCHVYHLYRVG